MKHNTLEMLTGAVVIVIATFFICYALKFSEHTRDKQTIYKAQFDRVDGLVLGADVKISGVKVGSIKRMIVDPKTFLAELTITVDDKMKLPKDSSAEIISESLMGSKYVAIIPGGDDEFLRPDDTITLTQSAVNLESLIGKMIFSNKSEGEGGSGPGVTSSI